MLKNLDKKQKIELTITGIGVIFLIFMLIGSLGKAHKRKRVAAKVRTESAALLSSPVSFGRDKAKESAIKQGWGRDPFFPGSTSVASDSGLAGFVLNGIVYGDDNPYALVNSDIVTIGDIVDDAVILEINEDNVVIEQDDKKYTLKVSPF